MANGQKQDGSIVTAEIADGAVTTPKLADLAVSTGKIAASAVTYAKMQNVSATDRLLGRVSASAGVVEEVVLDTDVTLAANSDDRVSTQKAVKAYVDAAVGGGGGLADLLSAGIAVLGKINNEGTINSSSGYGFGIGMWAPVPEAGNYYLKVRVHCDAAPSGNVTGMTLKTAAAIALAKVTTSAISTLIAANTTFGTYAKGSNLASGDTFEIISSSTYSLAAGDMLSVSNVSSPLILLSTGGTSIAANFSNLLAKK